MEKWMAAFSGGIFIFALSFTLHAQTGAISPPDKPLPQPTHYQVIKRDASQNVWERTIYEKAPDGTIIPKKHSYTELASGLNYLKNGQWVESKEEIDILPDGTAAATHGQHQAYFPGDIYNGQIEVVTPDGRRMKSRPLGLSYDDGTKTVLIAVLTNSTGVLAGSNQVSYPNAFGGVDADLLYTYRKGGFEQDIVLREQPPTPQSLGLNPDTARLQVLTEFFGAAEPVATKGPMNKQDGLADTTLAFGKMKMVQGKAFSFGNATPAGKVPVYKSWVHLQGRTFLIEELPVQRIAAQLEALPVSASATVSSASSLLHKASATRLLTPVRLVQAGTNTMQLAKADFKQKPGVVLDYVEFDAYSSGPDDGIFHGDTTYLVADIGISFPVFEGGTVVKFSEANTYGIYTLGGYTFESSAYRPVILTSMDDDTVGESIEGSTGTPVQSGSYLCDDGTYFGRPIHNVRFNHAGCGLYIIDVNGVDISDCQFVDCGTGIERHYFADEISLHNVLFDRCDVAVSFNGGGSEAALNAEQVTANVTTFAYCDTLNLTNCLIVGDLGSATTLNTNCTAINPSGTIFQTVGGGSYYLADGSPYRNAGTTNISRQTLADIQTKTTYPPIVCSNIVISVSTIWNQTVQRNTDTPDLGYHYDPLDYAISYVTVGDNTTLTLGNGVAVAAFQGTNINSADGVVAPGFYLGNNSSYGNNSTLNIIGTAQTHNHICSYQAVQEQSIGWGGYALDSATLIYIDGYDAQSELYARFTDFEGLNGLGGFGGRLVPSGCNVFGDTMQLDMRDCRVASGTFYCATFDGGYTNQCVNNVFERATFVYDNFDGWSPATFYNNLVRYGEVRQYTPFCVWRDNLFDNTTIDESFWDVTNDHNAYLNTAQMTPTNASDIVLTDFTYATGSLGNYYQASTNLINKGSTTANLTGLYHYTTQTNQVEETNSVVDIGYHYVALDQYGNIRDANDNNIPDWWELKYFGNLSHTNSNEDFDGDGHSIAYDYEHGIDPNIIDFTFFITNPNWITNTAVGNLTVFHGLPSSVAVLVDNTNFSAATWTACTTSNVLINLGTNWGEHDIWIGLRGLPSDAQQTWKDMKFFQTQAMIQAGETHNIFLDRDGTVWAWGYNGDGELGNGNWSDSSILMQVVGLSNIVAVAVSEGGYFSLALDANGIVWSWGANWSDQLGRNNGLYQNGNTAAPVAGLSNIVAIAAGEENGIALKSDRTVWTWGDNWGGKLGDGSGSGEERDYPVALTALTNIIVIGAGGDHCFALGDDGIVWGWGYNEDGELGITNMDNQPVPVPVTSLTNVTSLAGGWSHSIALQSDRTVKAWGYNGDGQLGNGTNGWWTSSSTPAPVLGLSNITAIACGGDHSLAVDTNGTLFLWGYGYDGELGNGSQDSTNVPFALNSISNVIAIAGGDISSLALTASGKLYEWGRDDELGTNYLQPVEADLFAVSSEDARNVSADFQSVFVNTNVTPAFVSGGAAIGMAVLVNNTNFASAVWIPFASPIWVHLGTTNGLYQVWFGFVGLNGSNYWSEANVILDMTSPTVSIIAPTNNTAVNASRINVQGTFAETNLKQITVNGIATFISSTNFSALNVPLDAGTNIINAIAEDLAGNTATSSIVIVGLTNIDGSLNDPVQLQATPIAGFAPLTVTFQIVSNNAPGTLQQVLYDFNGDGITDFVTNNLNSVTYTYATNGEYFPVVTIQTTNGLFSSSGGWNSTDPNRVQITVQLQVTQIASISITDPVDIKWTASSNLYVLSGSTATLTEFDASTNVIRSLSGIGSNPSGFDVDVNGNVYVAVTGSNQVWKLNPTDTSFVTDTSFGNEGFIGTTNGLTGTNSAEFNAPFDVAVSPDGGTISVSDSGNNRIEQFDSNGNFQNSFGSSGTSVGQFNVPKGLTYDSVGYLYIADSGNGRIVLAQDSVVLGVSGTNGTAFGQFSAPVNVSVGKHGIYVADTGNNRVQTFNPIVPHITPTPFTLRSVLSTNFNQPNSIAAVDDSLIDKFYVADTGNNRVVLYALTGDDPTPAWTNMTAHIVAGDVPGAVSYFSIASTDKYRQAFLSIGSSNLISAINQIGSLTPVFIKNDSAEYYFTNSVGGQTITFPVEFVKENGVWKILEF
ncbi:MAG TPA: hypothetical protein VE344_10035 [Methylomirabilota bacterium]|nr:hypothetical protein [Methylomirabilota bacterium]